MDEGRSKRPPRRWNGVLALAGAVLLGLSACGGGGDALTVAAAQAGPPQRLQIQAALDPATTWYRVTQLPITSEAGFVGRQGLDEAGRVAGLEATADGGRGFFFDGTTTTFFTPPAPSASGTWKTSVRFISGLNAAGQVVGGYEFEQTGAPPEAAPVEGYEAFSWSPAGGFVRLTPSALGAALDVNEGGQVAGFLASPVDPLSTQGFLWSATGGLVSDFGPNTRLAEASVVNASGLIAGPGSYLGTFGALLVDPGAGTTALLAAGPMDYARVADLNDAGMAAGEVLTLGDRFHAFVANPAGGGTVNLGPLIGAGNDSFAQDLNERGEVVLQARLYDRPPTTRVAAYFWSKTDGMIEMRPPAQAHTIPVAINNHGLAVGFHDEWSGTTYVGSRAFAWTKESGLVDLASRVQGPPPGFRLHAAMAVNDRGLIVASSSSGLVLLTPVGLEPAGEAPVVGAIASEDAVTAGARVSFSAEFTDADAGETHTATWTWGDGSAPQAGAVTGNAGAGRVTGSHVFREPGVYTVSLRVTDSAGRSSEVSRELVVQDRSAGFVKGSGWFASPPGAHRTDAGVADRAHFNFVAKYKKNGKPRKEHSQASFSFRSGSLNFRSTTLDSLSIAGTQARLEGRGQLDGLGPHRYLVTALDGRRPQDDRLRVRIWRHDAERRVDVVVYDNLVQPGGTGSPLGGGNIVVRPR